MASNGQYTTRIPIQVPAFRGLEPRIELSYASGGANGFVGVGWALTAGSSITRVSSYRGSPAFDARDVFLLDGMELLPCEASSVSPSCTSAAAAFGSASGFYSTRVETYRRIRRDTDEKKWIVWSPSGNVETYMTLNGGRSFNLTLLSDTHGNEVRFQVLVR